MISGLFLGFIIGFLIATVLWSSKCKRLEKEADKWSNKYYSRLTNHIIIEAG